MTVNTWESFFDKIMLWCVLQEINFFMVLPRLRVCDVSFCFPITSTCYINWKTICKQRGRGKREKVLLLRKVFFFIHLINLLWNAWHLSCFCVFLMNLKSLETISRMKVFTKFEWRENGIRFSVRRFAVYIVISLSIKLFRSKNFFRFSVTTQRRRMEKV